jgi:hypothetical protein
VLLYHLEFKGTAVWVRLQERNSRRILYLDTLQSLAQPVDQKPLALLTKNLLRKPKDTQTFQFIEIAPNDVAEVLCSMAATGRLFYQGKTLSAQSAKLSWEGEKPATLRAKLLIGPDIIPLESCERIAPWWFLHGSYVG